MKGKHARNTLEGLQRMITDLITMTGDPNTVVVRVHSDNGTEFQKEFDTWCEEQHIKRTVTGGYRSKGNSVAERRIRMLRESFIACLEVATGGAVIVALSVMSKLAGVAALDSSTRRLEQYELS